MKLLLISASNTITKKEKSASTKVCSLIENYIKNNFEHDLDIEIMTLVDKNLKPCGLCGACYKNGLCTDDDDFNQIYQKICESDKILIVVPHYSTIPSKLVIIFEKINELLYAGWIKDNSYTPMHKHISIGIIGHGGMPQNTQTLKYYHDYLVTPIANTLRSLNFKVVKPSDDFPNGAVFGLENNQSIQIVPDKVFPEIIQNYDLILDQIKPLVLQIMQ